MTEKKKTKKKLESFRRPLMVAQQPNSVWSADFMSNALYAGSRFRAFTLIDDFE